MRTLSPAEVITSLEGSAVRFTPVTSSISLAVAAEKNEVKAAKYPVSKVARRQQENVEL